MAARRRLRVVWLLLPVLLVTAVIVAVARKSDDPDDLPADGGPRQPEHGAWFGAYVDPLDGDFSQRGLIEALADYERRIGGPLDLVRTYYPWDKEFPRRIDRQVVEDGRILMIGWGGTRLTKILSGGQDELIRERARGLAGLRRPVLLAWRGEMDRPNLRDQIRDPQEYIAAWRRIRRLFAEEGARNVGWVWCPTAEGFADGRAQRYYPGDDQVDWLCADGYAFPELVPPERIFDAFLGWARGRPGKPVVIGEYGAESNQGRRAEWLRSFGAYVKRNPQIKGIAYYDRHHRHSAQTMMYYSLRDDPTSMAAFRALAHDPYFDPHRRRRG
ncbi:endoglucanase [Thermomonospora catenispora]|mgnify:CR=1 FL=1|uniref:endoglucanase n=1 Tax=Thermomonospora catenispora TaxID=2493090 RepID=UPI00111FA2E9|nr:endoglucanase [Thermomonospora catenispora]TNY37219.1 endoglucanase [Thermomonospora catenispora]